MTKQTFTCQVHETELLKPELTKRCTAGLAAGPQDDVPFMLSYDLYIHDGKVFAHPACRIWIGGSGWVQGRRVSDYPGLFRSFAPQIFSFLEMEALRDVFWSALCTLFPEGSGETFHACISPHGVILVAEQAQWVSHCHKIDPFVGFIEPGLSNHQALARLAGLQACATALLEAQHLGDPKDHPGEVRVKRA